MDWSSADESKLELVLWSRNSSGGGGRINSGGSNPSPLSLLLLLLEFRDTFNESSSSSITGGGMGACTWSLGGMGACTWSLGGMGASTCLLGRNGTPFVEGVSCWSRGFSPSIEISYPPSLPLVLPSLLPTDMFSPVPIPLVPVPTSTSCLVPVFSFKGDGSVAGSSSSELLSSRLVYSLLRTVSLPSKCEGMSSCLSSS